MRRAITHYVETCDFCKAEFYVTSEDPSMLHSVYYFYYGGYGDQQKIVETKDVCTKCYVSALNSGYGATHDSAAYIGSIKE